MMTYGFKPFYRAGVARYMASFPDELIHRKVEAIISTASQNKFLPI